MRILLTNDDGWGTAGLRTLEKVAAQFGEIVTVAPAAPQSGISHQLTFERPLNLVRRGPDSYELDGTPADCVRIALTQLPGRFDWVLSGINHGANLGSDIYVSGTVAAAREAWLQGNRAIAFSQFRSGGMDRAFDWQPAEELTRKVFKMLFEAASGNGRSLVNVNLPDVSGRSTKIDEVAVKWCQLDPNPLPTRFTLVDGGFMHSGVYRERTREAGCDIDLCFSGHVAITKLH
jgi:5'-nucleotidase